MHVPDFIPSYNTIEVDFKVIVVVLFFSDRIRFMCFPSFGVSILSRYLIPSPLFIIAPDFMLLVLNCLQKLGPVTVEISFSGSVQSTLFRDCTLTCRTMYKVLFHSIFCCSVNPQMLTFLILFWYSFLYPPLNVDRYGSPAAPCGRKPLLLCNC
jgi:hypothetical protein